MVPEWVLFLLFCWQAWGCFKAGHLIVAPSFYLLDIMEKKYRKIIEAIKKDDVKELKKLLVLETDALDCSKINYYPLKFAISNNSIETMKILLNIKYNSLNKYFGTLLPKVLKKGNYHIIESLINYEIYWYETFYIWISVEDKIIRYRIDDLFDQNNLELVLNESNGKIASLIMNKFDLPYKKSFEEIKLYIAISRREIKKAKELILEGIDIDLEYDDYGTILSHAVFYIRDIKFIQWLLKNGAHFETNNENNIISSIVSEFSDEFLNYEDRDYYTKVLSMFVENGLNIEMLYNFEISPKHFVEVLDLAAFEMIELINIMTKNSNEKKKLIYYCLENTLKRRNTEAFDIYLNTGVDIDYQDEDGTTILMSAVKAKELKFIDMILYKNPNLSLSNNNGKIVIDFVNSGNFELRKYINTIISSFERSEWYVKYLNNIKLSFIKKLLLKIQYFTTTLFFKTSIVIIALFILFFKQIVQKFPELFSILAIIWLYSLILTFASWDYRFYKNEKISLKHGKFRMRK